ncbi:hypothetical protein LTR37_009177 [Vermiconidia calcicola]|uniref:Uncharacterized protein n=1 Tax=Vermiconidia calcicola TaxID=1690605 RepID=A0ACC3N9W7_9PEZI|nr:hypothetical protein LTR37_009177 [Vermiconidia calcicola]
MPSRRSKVTQADFEKLQNLANNGYTAASQLIASHHPLVPTEVAGLKVLGASGDPEAARKVTNRQDAVREAMRKKRAETKRLAALGDPEAIAAIEKAKRYKKGYKGKGGAAKKGGAGGGVADVDGSEGANEGEKDVEEAVSVKQEDEEVAGAVEFDENEKIAVAEAIDESEKVAVAEAIDEGVEVDESEQMEEDDEAQKLMKSLIPKIKKAGNN